MRVLLCLAMLVASVFSAGSDGAEWQAQSFSNLVVFGDSFSDESRLTYFFAHNYSLPPAGTVMPEVS